MVFFAFHQYLATIFHINNFCAANYISIQFATWNNVSVYFVLNISQAILVFIFCGYLCYARKKPQYFTFMVRKSFTSSHLTKVQAFFYKMFEKFNNDLYWRWEICGNNISQLLICRNIAYNKLMGNKHVQSLRSSSRFILIVILISLSTT